MPPEVQDGVRDELPGTMEGCLAPSLCAVEFCAAPVGGGGCEVGDLVGGDCVDFAAAAGVDWGEFGGEDGWVWWGKKRGGCRCGSGGGGVVVG